MKLRRIAGLLLTAACAVSLLCPAAWAVNAGSVDKMIERLEYDILFYENMSLILDITILIYTVKTVFTGKGI